MPMSDRAAQFSPFAALTGYDEAIQETGRLTDQKILLSEDAKDILDWKMQQICEKLPAHPLVTIIYFVADQYKEGGSYIKITGQIKRIDDVERIIQMSDGRVIPVDDVYDLICADIHEEYE